MKTKRTFAILTIIITILLSFAGCSLALEDAGEPQEEDRLIGVFVTRENLNIFDADKYFEENSGKIAEGGEIANIDIDKYMGRLYATLKTRTLTDNETGETSEIQEFVFEGAEGIPYFSAVMPASKNEDGYVATNSDEALSDVRTAYNVSDDTNSTTLEATIYFSSDKFGSIVHFNPVYQTADGKVYVTSGDSFSADVDGAEGSAFTQTLEETVTITENEETKYEHTSVKMSVVSMYPPEKVVFLQMDKDNSIVSRAEYKPDEVPDSIFFEADAEYIIVETHKHDADGNETVSRELYGKSAEFIQTYYLREDGICAGRHIALKQSLSAAA